MYETIENKNNDGKKISFIIVGILTIVVAIAGASFAFFQVTASNNNVIKGTSAYTTNNLSLSVTLSSSYATGKLVPQLEKIGSTNLLQKAVTGTNSKSCVDGNNNTICKVYTITITNNTDTKFYVTGTLSLVADSMPNLKWGTGTSATTGFDGVTTSAVHEKTYTSLASNVELAANTSASYYVVVWISETGSAQTDSGSFTGTVTFNGYSTSGTSVSGITSTIRS